MLFLAADIGGTKTALAIYEVQGKNLQVVKQEKYPSKKYASLEDIIAKFLGKETIDSACFAIAGPIEKNTCKATNLPWVVRGSNISKRFKIKKVALINDLLANAYGIKVLSKKDLYVLNKGSPEKGSNQALISPGTGLGVATLFFDGEGVKPSPSEGGHVDFAPRNGLEVELLFYLREKFGHVSYERVLSGQGLNNLYRFLIDHSYHPEKASVKNAMKKEDPGRVISSFALSKKCPACVQALDWFCSLFGAAAGNFALTSLSLGCLYLGGGIPPKIKECIKKGDFMRSFKDKGRFASLLEAIPIYIILDPDTALKGSAYYCQNEMK